MKGCIDALQANYPTVARSSATSGSRRGRRFTRANLPRDGAGRLREGLCRFPRDFAAGARTALPRRCRAARPRLDRGPCRRRCTGAEAATSPAWRRTGCSMHAGAASGGALGLVPGQPVYTIWRRHREQAPLDAELSGTAKAVSSPAPAPSSLWCWTRARRPSWTSAREGGRSALPSGAHSRPGLRPASPRGCRHWSLPGPSPAWRAPRHERGSSDPRGLACGGRGACPSPALRYRRHGAPVSAH